MSLLLLFFLLPCPFARLAPIISLFFLDRILFSPTIHTVSRHRLVLNSYKPFLVHRSPPTSFITSLYFHFFSLSPSLSRHLSLLQLSFSPFLAFILTHLTWVALSTVSGIYCSSGIINPLLACLRYSPACPPVCLIYPFYLSISFFLWPSPPRVSCSNRVHSSCRLSPCLLLAPPSIIPYPLVALSSRVSDLRLWSLHNQSLLYTYST